VTLPGIEPGIAP